MWIWTSFSFIGIFCKLDCIFNDVINWIESWEPAFVTGVFRLKSCLISNGLNQCDDWCTRTSKRQQTFVYISQAIIEINWWFIWEIDFLHAN